MKELSIEEKARRYDEAIEIARKYRKDCKRNTWVVECMENMFPELAESEEEKTKRMLDVISYKMSQHQPDIFTGEENEWFYYWLKKQEEKVLDPRYSIFDKLIEADNIYQVAMTDAMIEKAKNKAIDALSNLEISKVLGLEKQGEQNHALSEVDKEMIQNIIDSIDTNLAASDFHEMEDWLKSLLKRLNFQLK